MNGWKWNLRAREKQRKHTATHTTTHTRHEQTLDQNKLAERIRSQAFPIIFPSLLGEGWWATLPFSTVIFLFPTHPLPRNMIEIVERWTLNVTTMRLQIAKTRVLAASGSHSRLCIVLSVWVANNCWSENIINMDLENYCSTNYRWLLSWIWIWNYSSMKYRNLLVAIVVVPWY